MDDAFQNEHQAQAARPLKVQLETVPRVQEGLRLVEQRLRHVVSEAASSAVQRVSLHLIEAGGKRLRPLMLLLAGEAAGGDATTMVDVAASIELLHVASLYFDDIMDEAQLRRGLPSANAEWGSRVAGTAGSYLVAKAMELLARRGGAFLEAANDGISRVWRGQMQELEGVYQLDRTEQVYLESISDKTAALYELPCELGAIAAGAEPVLARMLKSFGHNLGMAFQIVDDLLDVLGTQERLGKPAGADIGAGVYTLAVIRAMEGHNGPLLRRLLAPQSIDQVSLEQAVRLVRDSSGLRDAAFCAQQFIEYALADLHGLPWCAAVDALRATAIVVIDHPELAELRGEALHENRARI